MGLIYINTYCKECDSESIMSSYDEVLNDIKCVCLSCRNEGYLKDFNYVVDGDTEI